MKQPKLNLKRAFCSRHDCERQELCDEIKRLHAELDRLRAELGRAVRTDLAQAAVDLEPALDKTLAEYERRGLKR